MSGAGLSTKTGDSRSTSPTDSEASASSHTSNSSRKRGRDEEGPEDEIVKPKRITRQKITLATVMDELKTISNNQSRQGDLLHELPAIRVAVDAVSADVSALKTTTPTTLGNY